MWRMMRMWRGRKSIDSAVMVVVSSSSSTSSSSSCRTRMVVVVMVTRLSLLCVCVYIDILIYCILLYRRSTRSIHVCVCVLSIELPPVGDVIMTSAKRSPGRESGPMRAHSSLVSRCDIQVVLSLFIYSMREREMFIHNVCKHVCMYVYILYIRVYNRTILEYPTNTHTHTPSSDFVLFCFQRGRLRRTKSWIAHGSGNDDSGWDGGGGGDITSRRLPPSHHRHHDDDDLV